MKITNPIRAKIVENAIKASEVPVRRDIVKASLKRFALEVYDHAIKVPEGIAALWANKDLRGELVDYVSLGQYLEIECEGFGYRHHGYRKGHDYYRPENLDYKLTFDDPKLMPHRVGAIKIKGTPLEQRAQDLITYHRETNAIEDDLTTKLNGIVYAANTKAQLLAIWPEGEKFLPPETKVERKGAMVAAESILAVNKALGITK